jgi:mannose-6-phosphate isomerase-like protein (cupin superfamily)
MLIDNEKVQKIHLMGFMHQTLAGENQGLQTMEVWLLTLPPGSETPVNQHHGEVVVITLQGTGRVMVNEDTMNLFPNTTLVIPAQATRQAMNTGEEELMLLVIRSLVTPPENRHDREEGKQALAGLRGANSLR